MRSRIIFVPLAISLIASLLIGCDEPPLKEGVADWKPQSTGGPIELRPLPPPQQVYSNYEQWLNSETADKVRLYEVVLMGATNQVGFDVGTVRGDTPGGAGETTFVTLHYRDSTNGTYQLEWRMRGRQNTDFLKVDSRPKTVWLQLFGTPEESAYCRLEIVAIEGIESRQVLVAQPGLAPK